ncbi:MAG TPA: hypothetical protein PK644_00995, partial [bacterium]|nr:hypothetical protein [bacterium]
MVKIVLRLVSGFFFLSSFAFGQKVVNFPFQKEGEGVSILARCGQVKGGMEVGLAREEKKIDVKFSLLATDMVELNHHYGTSKVPQGLKDAGLSVVLTGNHGWPTGAIRFVYFIRPDIHFYTGEDF